jgi:DNA-binding response OmpR family regulator
LLQYPSNTFDEAGMMASTILLLEDDRLFNETLQDFLEEEGFVLSCAFDPHTALEYTYAQQFDLYLFDVNLPYESGLDLLGRLRESGDTTPTIFLTSREDKASLTKGFLRGADDYLRKPVDLDELLLRIHAVLRRQIREEELAIGSYRLNRISKSLIGSSGEAVEISQKALELLIVLLEADGSVVSSELIKDTLWQASKTPSEGSLRVYITQIKKHFPEAIQNIRGVGYLFDRTKAAASNVH